MMNNYSNPRSCGYNMKSDMGRSCPPQRQTNGGNNSCCAPKQENRSSDNKKENCMRPTRSKYELLKYIDEVSFAVVDMNLYLDTHPCDECALAFCLENVKLRNEALEEYARFYGPLTIDTTDDVKSDSWEWALQPWPWEGKEC